METAKTLGLVVAIILIVAFVAWEQRPQDEATATTSPTPSVAIASPTPLPELAPGWQWTPTPGTFHLAYPSMLVTQAGTEPIEATLGSTRITLLARLLSPRGYFTTGIVSSPYSATTIIENDSVRDITPVTVPFGSGIRYVFGNKQCATTAYRFPLGNEMLRISWSSCSDQRNRFDQDYALHTAVLNTLER